MIATKNQPPSRGCELKQDAEHQADGKQAQPPSRGCELKHNEDSYGDIVRPSRLRAAVS